MASLYTHQDENVRKTYLLFAAFLVLVGAIGWFFSYLYNNSAIFYGAIFFSLAMNIASYWFSDRLVVALSRAVPADPSEYRELHQIVENLAITAGLPKPKVYIIEDPAPNAFATGRDKEHAVVAATTGLLSILTKTELEGVIGHELSHIGNRDILVSTVAVLLAGCISILADMFLRSLWWGGGRDRDRGNGILTVVGILLAILAPIFGTLMQLAISRRREFLADASGALLTRYPEGLASALEKIGQYARPMLTPSSATAHLFIANPFGPGKRAWTTLFMSHPPIEERIAALRGQS
ncbi:MAG: M48 family metalloprotease [Patescibacteria group bacterium]